MTHSSVTDRLREAARLSALTHPEIDEPLFVIPWYVHEADHEAQAAMEALPYVASADGPAWRTGWRPQYYVLPSGDSLTVSR